MDTDDLEPPIRKAEIRDMEVMSIEALHDYIAELEAEIARARAMIDSKQWCAGRGREVFQVLKQR